MPLLSCIKCNAPLLCLENTIVCEHCNSKWPVVNGIPRFFQSETHYWGEVGRVEAREMLEAARKGPWRDAVLGRFSNDANMHHGLLDLQRASWAPALGIDEDSVILDIGSGYGAITHSLAKSAGEVYSVEAVAERIEFTQERLRQEGLQNVRLIQASATALPFAQNSFDVVVTNGVLEWVGEWDLSVNPRQVQINFLRTIASLLKDDGVLVIGIENRFGWGLFLGSNDHSGLPYTSLVPRRIASFMLRHSKQQHYRTQLNSDKEYRTYTYSEKGYRKLLRESGLPDVSIYWANPGYNQPYHLVPLSKPEWVREHFVSLLSHPGPAPRRSWRRSLKHMAAKLPFLSQVMPDFLLFASKSGHTQNKFQSWLEERYLETCITGQGRPPAEHIQWALYTQPFKPKTVVRTAELKTGKDFAYIKIHVTSLPGATDPELEPANRETIRKQLITAGARFVQIPYSIDTLRLGKTCYCMETAAKGKQLSRMVRELGYFDDDKRVRRDFLRVFNGVLELTSVLRNATDVKAIDPAWLCAPKELSEETSSLEAARYFSSHTRECWTQHGDFSVENIYFDAGTGRIEVFDWVDLAAGLPPLYDVFQLFLSTGYLSTEDQSRRFKGETERWLATFESVLLRETQFSRLVKEFILQFCQHFRIRPTLIPELLLEFLILRVNYAQKKSPAQRVVYLRMLKMALERGRSIFGTWPQVHAPVTSIHER